MSEVEELLNVANDLVAAWMENRVAEVELSTDHAVALVSAMHANLDHWIDARAEAARARSLNIVCEAGCSACCRNLVMVFRGESLAVAAWLRRDENREARETFLANYRRWRDDVGDAPEKASQARRDQDDRRFATIATGVWRSGAMCALNHDDLCLAYEVRPNACRNCHALDTNEYCSPEAGRAPDTLDTPQIDQVRDELRALSEALHESLGGEPGVLVSLCEDVYQQLTQ